MYNCSVNQKQQTMKTKEKFIELLNSMINDLEFDFKQDWNEDKQKTLLDIQLLLSAKANIEQSIKLNQ